MQGTADLHHHIAGALLPEADAIFHNATALHATLIIPLFFSGFDS